MIGPYRKACPHTLQLVNLQLPFSSASLVCNQTYAHSRRWESVPFDFSDNLEASHIDPVVRKKSETLTGFWVLL